MAKKSPQARKAEDPNKTFTRIPNWILDRVINAPFLPDGDFRVLLFILRKLTGWHRDSFYISLQGIQDGAGVGRTQACRAAKRWARVGIFERETCADHRTPAKYSLVRDVDPDKVIERLDAELVAERDRRGPASVPLEVSD